MYVIYMQSIPVELRAGLGRIRLTILDPEG